MTNKQTRTVTVGLLTTVTTVCVFTAQRSASAVYARALSPGPFLGIGSPKIPGGNSRDFFSKFHIFYLYWSLVVKYHVKVTIFEFNFKTSMNCESSKQNNTRPHRSFSYSVYDVITDSAEFALCTSLQPGPD